MIIAPEISLAALIDRYDYFLVDQFGVLRDDVGAYDGAAAALRALKDRGKHVIVLSNSGRSGDYNAERFVRLGFDRELFERFVTSRRRCLRYIVGILGHSARHAGLYHLQRRRSKSG